jgi:hypothetical protein
MYRYILYVNNNRKPLKFEYASGSKNWLYRPVGGGAVGLPKVALEVDSALSLIYD